LPTASPRAPCATPIFISKLVEQIPKLGQLFGVEVFQSKLETLCLSSLRDSVSSVREATIEHVRAIAEAFGPRWTVEHFLPKVLDQYSQSASYVCRVTMLHVLPRVSEGMSPEQVMQHIMPVLVKATKDDEESLIQVSQDPDLNP